MAIYQIIEISKPGTFPPAYKIEANSLHDAKRIASVNQKNKNTKIIILSETGIKLALKNNNKWSDATFNSDPCFTR